MAKWKSKFNKMALGYALALSMLLASVIPASAAGVQFKDFNADTAVQEALEEAVEEVDKSALAAAIEAAAGLVEADYTPETWAVFAAAFAAAEAVLGDTAATQEAVDAALAELNGAVEALEEAVEEVDKSALAAAIETASGLNEADYTAKSWRKLAKALEAARAVMEDERAPQKKVDQALEKLNKAMDALEAVEKVDKSALAAAIEAASGLNEADYTAKSWRKLVKALEAARAVMGDEQATQKKVDQALEKLNKAMESLEEAAEEDEKGIPMAIYQELLDAFTRLQNTYDKLLVIFANIFGLSVLPQ